MRDREDIRLRSLRRRGRRLKDLYGKATGHVSKLSGSFRTVVARLAQVGARVAALMDFYSCADRDLKKAAEGENPIASPVTRWSQAESKELSDIQITRKAVQDSALELEGTVRSSEKHLAPAMERSTAESASLVNRLAHNAQETYNKLERRARVLLVPYCESRQDYRRLKRQSFYARAALGMALAHAVSSGSMVGMEARLAMREILARTTASYSVFETAAPSHRVEYQGYKRYSYFPSQVRDREKEAAENAKSMHEGLDKLSSLFHEKSKTTDLRGRGVVPVSMNITSEGTRLRRVFSVSDTTFKFDYGGHNVAYT